MSGTMKICKKCGRELPATIDYFMSYSRNKDGFEKTCRECKGLRFYTSETWICPRCHRDLPFTEEYWKPSKTEPSGWYLSMCRDCFNAYYREHVKNNPEQRREKERKYAEKHPDKIAEKMARAHKKAVESGKNKYCNRNIEKCREYERKRWAENPNRKEWDRKRWEYRKTHGYNDRAKELYIENPMPKRTNANRRRVVKANAKGTHDGVQFEIKFKYHGERCYYCHDPLTLGEATEDHRIPLSRGGTDWVANIVPACKSCNSSKGTKTEQEYYEYLINNGRAL